MLLLNKPNKQNSFLLYALIKGAVCLFLILVAIPASAQKKYTISGTVKDAATGEVLIGATVKLKEIAQNGTSSNSYGFYSLSAVVGDYTLLVSYVGYTPAAFAVKLTGDKNID